jgi:hypothetical protein
MKLYHINPNDFGGEYFVMSSSKETALVALKRFYLKMASDPTNPVRSIYQDDYNTLWQNATVDSLPPKYTIDEYGFDDVVETEIC